MFPRRHRDTCVRVSLERVAAAADEEGKREDFVFRKPQMATQRRVEMMAIQVWRAARTTTSHGNTNDLQNVSGSFSLPSP